MIDKNNYYWSLHKKFLKSELDAMDNEFSYKIAQNPHSNEARNLNKRVELMVEQELMALVPENIEE